MEEKSEYDNQAEQFLKDTGTTLKFAFIENGLHFQGDKEPRDIWKVTFKRASEKFSVKFGQSIAHTGKKPSAYDILSCITKSNPESFKEFCSDFGYNEDSRTAEKTYKAVVKEWNKVKFFFLPEEIAKLQEIQ